MIIIIDYYYRKKLYFGGGVAQVASSDYGGRARESNWRLNKRLVSPAERHSGIMASSTAIIHIFNFHFQKTNFRFHQLQLSFSKHKLPFYIKINIPLKLPWNIALKFSIKKLLKSDTSHSNSTKHV